MSAKQSSNSKRPGDDSDQHQAQSLMSRVTSSFQNSIGDIIFGMEDGLVSIFGLVFGVAASAPSSGAVLTAGVVGAAAAAISMGAGTWLDKQSERSHAVWQLQQEDTEVRQHPQSELAEERRRMRKGGLGEQDTQLILQALRHNPEAMQRFEAAYELDALGTSQVNAVGHALWMFGADILASGTPVVPYAFLNLSLARIVSTSLAVIFLIALGVGRALYAHQPLWSTVLITLGIGGGAATAGVLFGRLFG